MLSDKILYQLILRQLDTKASDALITYSDAYAYALREDSAISSPTPGERKWNAAVVALIEAERAHLQEILLRHDRRTMEIGSVVLFLRGFERLLKLVGPLPKKEEAPVRGGDLVWFEWTQRPATTPLVDLWGVEWEHYSLITAEYSNGLLWVSFCSRGNELATWTTSALGTRDMMRDFFGKICGWLRDRKHPIKGVIALHPKYERAPQVPR